MLNAHLSLQGEYSVDIYKKDGTLKQSLGPFKNFITSTGLSYISKYAIADCFRYVSVGLGSTTNTLLGNNGWGTSNLQQIVPQYSYIGGRSSQSDPGHVTSQYTTASFTETTSGISWTRGWRIPAGAGNFFDADYTFKEVMLSPGRPAVTGISFNPSDQGNPTSFNSTTATNLTDSNQVGNWTNNQWNGYYLKLYDTFTAISQYRLITNTVGSTATIYWATPLDSSDSIGNYIYNILPLYSLCDCLQTDQDLTNATVNGLDYSASAIAYRNQNICSATGAFIRVVKDMVVAHSDFMIFNYTLYANIDTGRRDFKITVNNLRGTNTTTNWNASAVSGCHQLIHHGLKYISNGSINVPSPWGQMDQVTYFDADSDFGESFIGPWGSPLEPSTVNTQLTAYITTDNLQFYANAIEGGAYTASVPGFDSTSGLMFWRSTPYADAASAGFFDTRLFNIRRTADGSNYYHTPFWPLNTNYTTETTTPDVDMQHTVLAFDQTFQASVNITPYASPATRYRQATRSFQFAGNTAGANAFLGLPVRGIVLNYLSPSQTTTTIPYLDALFTDSGAPANPSTTAIHWPRTIPTGNVPNTSYDTGSYGYWNYIDNVGSNPGLLTVSFVETWSSPCNPDVIGC